MGLDALSRYDNPRENAKEERLRTTNIERFGKNAEKRVLLLEHLKYVTDIVNNPQEGQRQAESVDYLVDNIGDLRELAAEITKINRQLQHPILRALLSQQK